MGKQSMNNGWVRGKFIGRGCFGTVSAAVNGSDGRVFAVKSVDLTTCLPSQVESLENEMGVLRSLPSHPHVVGYLGDDVTKEGTSSFRNLHLEYVPRGTVAELAEEGIDEGLIRRFTRCLVSALLHLHTCGIVHCDVKGRNVLVGPDPSSVKLADFGSAIEVKVKAGGYSSTVPILPRGSPLWMAPEVVRCEYQGPESDIWSLGCTVIEMVAGKPAWEDNGVASLSRIGFSDEVPRVPTRLSELGRDFLDKCLKRERSKRWSCDQLLQHPFLSLEQYSVAESSPRCVLDWANSELVEEGEEKREWESGSISARDRICKLAKTGGAIWESDGWVDVRGSECFEEQGTIVEFTTLTRAAKSQWLSSDSELLTEPERVKRESGLLFGGGYTLGKMGSAVEKRQMLSCDLLLWVDNIHFCHFLVNETISIPYYNSIQLQSPGFSFILRFKIFFSARNKTRSNIQLGKLDAQKGLAWHWEGSYGNFV